MAAWTSYSHAKTSQWEDIRPSLVFLWPQCWVSLWRHFLAAHRPFLLTNNVHLKYSRCCNSVRMEYFLQGFSSHICWYRQPADRRLINSQKILSTTGISVLLTPYLEQMPVFIAVSRMILNISQNHFLIKQGDSKYVKTWQNEKRDGKGRVYVSSYQYGACTSSLVHSSAAQFQEKFTPVNSWWCSRKHTRA